MAIFQFAMLVITRGYPWYGSIGHIPLHSAPPAQERPQTRGVKKSGWWDWHQRKDSEKYANFHRTNQPSGNELYNVIRPVYALNPVTLPWICSEFRASSNQTRHSWKWLIFSSDIHWDPRDPWEMPRDRPTWIGLKGLNPISNWGWTGNHNELGNLFSTSINKGKTCSAFEHAL